MESRGKIVSMLDTPEETALITPNKNIKKDNGKDNVINKIFGSLIANKEDK